ncbi:hypothetical protein ACN3XK_31485 [Actinomadura welshii]
MRPFRPAGALRDFAAELTTAASATGTSGPGPSSAGSDGAR